VAEPPYGVIWDLLKTGQVVPFLGAGASFVGRGSDAAWNAENSTFLPSGGELADFLARKTMFPSQDPAERKDLAKVCSYYSDVSGRPRLRGALRQILIQNYQYGPLHKFLASLPGPQVVVVTNYDDLVEKAFQAASKPYDLVIYPAERKDLANAILWWPYGEQVPKERPPNALDRDIDLTRTTVIYKMHGSVGRDTEDHDHFVITEEDYVDFLSRMTTNAAVPSLFYPYFRERSFLFLGYSLRDWNLRVVLKNLSRNLRTRRGRNGQNEDEALPSWAIQYRPSELEKKLWEKRNVEIYDLTIDEFVAKLLEQGKS
jgi:hypothetical protein